MNYLNKLRIVVLAFLVAALGTSCTDLGVENFDSEIIEATEGGSLSFNATELLESMYTDRIGVMTNQANIYSLGVHTSDELLPPTRGVDWSDNGVWRTLHQHTWDATQSFITNSWNELNERVFFTNQILASSTATPEEIAEGKALRAFFMWHVMDYFGQVPIREATDGPDVLPRVLTRSEAVDFIKQDLNDAIATLDVLGPDRERIKISGEVARGLLARVLINEEVYTGSAGDMNRVIELVDEITAGGYSLETNFFDNFSTDATTEVMWTSGAGSPQNRWFMTLHYNQNPSGWNGFTTIAEHFDRFEAGDSRLSDGGPGTAGYEFDASDFGSEFSGFGRGYLIGQQYNDDGTELIDSRTNIPLSFTRDVPLSGAPTGTGIRHHKYHPRFTGDGIVYNYILMRYADMYLLKAEALLRSGSTSEALEMVNDLRTLRGAGALGSLSETDILDERARELAWEGNRRTDQIRFGTFNNTWSEKENTEAFRVLFPIPAPALSSNPNLVQNEGY